MSKDPRAAYAQSSDVKARTFLEYRHDMKKKAIAELEIMEWLEGLLTKRAGKPVEVNKSGGDQHIWFLRKGGITSGPDYEVVKENKTEKYEFQYAETDDLKLFDFKVSKVGKLSEHRIREPFKDRKFIYIIKSKAKYAILTPKWIIDNSTEDGVPAWGNRKARRVPRDVFLKKFTKDSDLAEIVESINKKNDLLEYQAKLYEQESTRLSTELQKIIDKDKQFSIPPKDISGFYESCFLMNRLNRIPDNRNLWIGYLASYLSKDLNSRELFQFMFSLDYLYSSITVLQENELKVVVDSIKEVAKLLKDHSNADFRTANDLGPKDEVRNYLFSINLWEDISQDIIANYKSAAYNPGLKPTKKIFESVSEIDKIYSIVSAPE